MPRECLQQAYVAHWLDDEGEWLSMLKDRNFTLHSYKEEVAWDIYRRLPDHLAAMQALHQLLSQRFGGSAGE
ncbi:MULTISPECIES: nucleotidyltransferase substrate binding protein [Zobellella]|uniref:nucleotidyltransferase substrate binding protein n=1 Tax=Zobellella TaxID=347533 RepID=UPI0020CD95E2|nr:MULTISPECIES: nucleotidyltransferase substrate binding protein [Zobellella]